MPEQRRRRSIPGSRSCSSPRERSAKKPISSMHGSASKSAAPKAAGFYNFIGVFGKERWCRINRHRRSSPSSSFLAWSRPQPKGGSPFATASMNWSSHRNGGRLQCLWIAAGISRRPRWRHFSWAFLVFYAVFQPRPYKEAFQAAMADDGYNTALEAYTNLRANRFSRSRATELMQQFWEQRALRYALAGKRDESLLSYLQGLGLKDSERLRSRIGNLVSSDYDQLRLTLWHGLSVETVAFS